MHELRTDRLSSLFKPAVSGAFPPRTTARWGTLLIVGTWACSGITDSGPVIVIVQQPTQAVVNEVLVPGVEVRVEDAGGDPISGEVSIAIEPNPCAWPLGGTTSVQAIEGQAIFEDLRLERVAQGYRLIVKHASAQAVTEPIDVAAQAIPGEALVLENTLCAKPNGQRDAESLAYAPESDSFWLADDDVPSIFEVDRATGLYRRQLPAALFVAAFPTAGQCDDGDNDPVTSCSYVDEFEHVAYDANNGLMYVMNTVNSPVAVPNKDQGAIFKLRRGGGGCSSCWGFEGWQPLPDGDFEGMVVIDGALYFVLDDRMYAYDYDTNRVLSTDTNGDPLPAAYMASHTLQRVNYDGTYLWVVVSPLRVKKIVWETGTEVASYGLAPFGISAPKGVEIIGDRLYVLEGNPPNPIYVFRLTPGP